MATTTVLENVITDSVQTDELNSGNLIVRGAARFLNPIHANIHGSQDINRVASSTAVADTDYVLVTNGTSLRRVLFTDFAVAASQTNGGTATYSDILNLLSDVGF